MSVIGCSVVLFLSNVNMVDESSFKFGLFLVLIGLLNLINFLIFLKEYVVKLVMISKGESDGDVDINFIVVLVNYLVLSSLCDDNSKKIFLLVLLKKWKVFDFRCFFLNGIE